MEASIDTSVLIAAMVASEPFHERCRSLVAGGEMVFYAHGITETFSTLTGGRKGFRLRPDSASNMLEKHFIPRLRIVTLTANEMLRAMRDCQERGVRGGAVFDYLHLVAARKAKAGRLYTLDVSHFKAFHQAGDPEIVHP